MEQTEKQYEAMVASQFDDVREGTELCKKLELIIHTETSEIRISQLRQLRNVLLLKTCCSLVLIDIETLQSAIPHDTEKHAIYECKFFL